MKKIAKELKMNRLEIIKKNSVQRKFRIKVKILIEIILLKIINRKKITIYQQNNRQKKSKIYPKRKTTINQRTISKTIIKCKKTFQLIKKNNSKPNNKKKKQFRKLCYSLDYNNLKDLIKNHSLQLNL